MEPTKPKVSIGLAVYNGEDYLVEAIESILQQTFTDFELIISDNASTDRTAEICRRYADQDPRIRYHRNATNIGGANNENQTFRLARGEYFRWAAHDDVCAPELLENSVAVLDADPDVVLCYTYIKEIDETSQVTRERQLHRGLSPRPHQRFRDFVFRDHACEATYGLMRSAVMARTALQKNYTDSDRVLLCELALYGRFYEIPEPLFYKRHHQKNVYLDWRARMAWFNPAWKGKIAFPNWLQLFDCLDTLRRVPLPMGEKFLCYLTMIPWLIRYSRHMVKDLLVALQMAIYSREWRRRDASIYNWE
ncbi:MAG: glycosyltransferase [Caldilineaceae bacterium]